MAPWFCPEPDAEEGSSPCPVNIGAPRGGALSRSGATSITTGRAIRDAMGVPDRRPWGSISEKLVFRRLDREVRSAWVPLQDAKGVARPLGVGGARMRRHLPFRLSLSERGFDERDPDQTARSSDRVAIRAPRR